ncbi:MAG: hypothetical protein R3B47_09680 [Bacteroidia bacterium]
MMAPHASRGTLVMQGNAQYAWDADVWFINKRNWADWSALGRSYKGTDPVTQ